MLSSGGNVRPDQCPAMLACPVRPMASAEVIKATDAGLGRVRGSEVRRLDDEHVIFRTNRSKSSSCPCLVRPAALACSRGCDVDSAGRAGQLGQGPVSRPWSRPPTELETHLIPLYQAQIVPVRTCKSSAGCW